MTLNRLSQIGSVLQNAIAFDFKNSPEVIMETESLFAAVDRLFSLLEERRIDYVLVGGIAMLTHVEGRNTQDIDLIITIPALAKLPEIEITSQNPYFARGRLGELQMDLLFTRNPLFRVVRQHFTTLKQFSGRKIRVATVEGLILLKLYALPSLYRQGSFSQVSLYENDIAILLHDFQPALEPLLAVLEPHLDASDLQEIGTILDEVKERIKRFGK
jgi:hypothetical protein